MRTSAIFQPGSPNDLVDFIARYPLAQVVSASDCNYEATPVPLVAEVDEAGTLVGFIGHFARSNPQVELIRKNPRAIAIFLGAHGYVSPSWMRDRSQAPTWNFETAHFVVDITLMDTAGEASAAIERLLDQVEADGPRRWQSHELGERRGRLLKGVVGFVATIVETRVKLKLGQNERQDVYEDIVLGLETAGNHKLAEAMKWANCRTTEA